MHLVSISELEKVSVAINRMVFEIGNKGIATMTEGERRVLRGNRKANWVRGAAFRHVLGDRRKGRGRRNLVRRSALNIPKTTKAGEASGRGYEGRHGLMGPGVVCDGEGEACNLPFFRAIALLCHFRRHDDHRAFSRRRAVRRVDVSLEVRPATWREGGKACQ